MVKRGQAAMEFIMTYGWALMVVMIVVGALSYFGVLNPSDWVDEKCTFPPGMTCEDFYLTNTGWNFYFLNGKGRGITISSINVESATGDSYVCENKTLNTAIANGATATFDMPGICVDQGLTVGDKLRFDVQVNYTFEGGVYSHIESGELFARVN